MNELSTPLDNSQELLIDPENPKQLVEEQKDENEDQSDGESQSEIQLVETKSHSRVVAIITVILIDLIIPLMLVLSAISAMQVLGIAFLLLLYIHVFVSNSIKTSFTPLKICLSIDFAINLIVFIFAIVAYSVDFSQSEAIHIIGLDFNNIISKKPTFNLVTSLIAMIGQITVLSMIGMSDVQEVCQIRINVFNSLGFQLFLEFFWVVCNAFNASTNMSYVYIPILAYFIYSNISQSITGRVVLPKFIVWIVMLYSLLFALFELYMVSDIAYEDKIESATKYVYIAPDATKAVNVVAAVIFAFISAQEMSAPGLDICKPKPIPYGLSYISQGLLYIAFICAFIYGCFYSNYFSLGWMLITFMASFVPFNKTRKFFFPLLTIFFTITFIVIILTTFDIIPEPPDEGTERTKEFLMLFGLYRYSHDFTFSCCGFFLNCFFGLIGRMIRARVVAETYKPEEDEVNNETFGQRFKRGFKKAMTSFVEFIYILLKFAAILAIVTLGITVGFYENRFAYHILGVIFIIVVLLGLYKVWVFNILKTLTFLIIVFGAYYKITINDRCINQLNECLIFGQWDNDVNKMIDTGLIPPVSQSFMSFSWGLVIIYILSVFLTINTNALVIDMPGFISQALFLIIAILHFLYMFLYDTNFFSILFLLVGLSMITSQYLKNIKWIIVSCCASSIIISILLCLQMLSHFDGPRNFLASTIPFIIDISHIHGPNGDIIILAITLFLSTFALNMKETKQPNFYIAGIIYEIRLILDLFYFYLCWIFIFAFSIINNNPSFIKFIIMLFFAFGKWSAPIFYKIRIPFLIFNIVYAVAQYVSHIFGFDDVTQSYYPIMNYVGMYFSAPGKPTKSERNISLLLQLIVMLIGIFNIPPVDRHESDPRYEAMLPTKLYNAICSMLHHFLPVLIQISLCTSTLYNPSIFGWLSFVIMIFVNFKPSALTNSAGVITILFNICFIIQYLLYLGWPTGIFPGYFNVMKYINETSLSDETKVFINDWLRWAGVYDVKSKALISNCISAYIFTFYMTWSNNFVDYDSRFNALPELLKKVISWIVTYIFEILMSVILIIAVSIVTVDGFLFFILAASLFLTSQLFEYPKLKTLFLLSIVTFCVIALRLLSRMPIFIETGLGEWIKRAFDLPFQGESSTEFNWIIIYTVERVCIHILKSNIYAECSGEHLRHQAYKFIRSRQLSVIEKIDQEILIKKREFEMQQIRSMTGQNVELIISSNNNNEVQQSKKPKNKNKNEPESEKVKEKVNKKKQIKNTGINFILNIIPTLINKFVKLLARSLPVNSEAGVNVLTLESIIVFMKKYLRSLSLGREYKPDLKEINFLSSLPPSFHYHYHILADIMHYDIYNSGQRFQLFLRYILFFIRKISLPLLTLISLIFFYVKPYFFGFLILLFVLILLPLDIRSPIIYRAFFSIILIMLGFRALCTVGILQEQLEILLNSVQITQMDINVISFFGLNPNESSVLEILVFLCAELYIADQIQQIQIFSPKYYDQQFKKELTNYPLEFTYGVINNPENSLSLLSEGVPFIEQIKRSLSRLGLIETYHRGYLFIVDVISIITLFAEWNKWSQNDASASGVSITPAFIFILLIQFLFMVICYACCLNNNRIVLFIINLIMFVYTYIIVYIYLPTCNRTTFASLQFFFFTRFCSHLIISHLCFVGRTICALKFPNFVKEWRSINFFNRFIHIFPYLFEVQTILLWISKPTYVSLIDFFIIRDINMQLEALIASQKNPKKNIKHKNTYNILISAIILALFVIIVFGILFLLSSNSSSGTNNPPISAEIEIGLTNFPPLFTVQGVIMSITSNQHQQFHDTSIENLNSLVLANDDSLFVVGFPTVSSESWIPDDDILPSITETLTSPNEVTPYVKFSLFFTEPTSISSVQNVEYQNIIQPLTEQQKMDLNDLLNGGSRAELFPIPLPLALLIPTSESIRGIDNFTREMRLELLDDTWTITGETNNIPVEFLRTEGYTMVIWSQPVSGNLLGSSSSSSLTTLIIYLIIVIVVGLGIRRIILGKMSTLWIDNMEEPQNLYRMIVAINAYRSAGEMAKESELTENLLDILRSHEKCVAMTSKK